MEVTSFAALERPENPMLVMRVMTSGSNGNRLRGNTTATMHIADVAHHAGRVRSTSVKSPGHRFACRSFCSTTARPRTSTSILHKSILGSRTCDASRRASPLVLVLSSASRTRPGPASSSSNISLESSPSGRTSIGPIPASTIHRKQTSGDALDQRPPVVGDDGVLRIVLAALADLDGGDDAVVPPVQVLEGVVARAEPQSLERDLRGESSGT